jgi:hypothetical protein
METQDYQLKPLPELTATQSWCCEHGCGETKPRVDQFEYSRTEDKHGRLLESKAAPVWRSTCCGAELFLFDDATQTSTPWVD